MLTVLEVIGKTAEFFASKGIESPRLDAELLVGHALGLPRMQLYLQFDRALTEKELEAIRPLARRRGQREPLQYILGSVEFHGLKLGVDPRALIPRPETERLVEIVIERCGAAPPGRIVDLGTGAGAIALALARAWPESAVTALDSSGEALALARANAEATGLSGRMAFLRSDWFSALSPEARFDLAVANPPYLSDGEVAASAPEVRVHEPASALEGDVGGLGPARRILAEAPARLSPGGMLALETGPGHHAELLRLADERGFARAESLKDLAGRDRYILAWSRM